MHRHLRFGSSSLCVLAVTAVSQLELAVTQHLPALKRGKILNTNFLTSFGSGMRMVLQLYASSAQWYDK